MISWLKRLTSEEKQKEEVTEGKIIGVGIVNYDYGGFEPGQAVLISLEDGRTFKFSPHKQDVLNYWNGKNVKITFVEKPYFNILVKIEEIGK